MCCFYKETQNGIARQLYCDLRTILIRGLYWAVNYILMDRLGFLKKKIGSRVAAVLDSLLLQNRVH